MGQKSQELYSQFVGIMQKAADLNNASAVLGWDQEVYMPPKSANFRAQQLATLTSLAHEMVTTPEFGKILHELSAANDLSEDQKANIALSLYDYDKNIKLPTSFVEQLSRQTSVCFNTWIEARQKNDFSVFAPELEKMVALKLQQTELTGYNNHPYNALLDEYERGITVAKLDVVFNTVKEKLPAIIADIIKRQPAASGIFHQHYPANAQWDFSMDVLKAMGYDLEAGRQDYAEHPFTTSFSPEDVRVTTRVKENDYAYMLWSTIHEGGHALYEQGLPTAQYGLPLGSAASLGIHESQSRLWENCVGRGEDFWSHFLPKLKNYFPEQLKNATVKELLQTTNRVEPSLIRTEADEVTYHFHVMIRYEVEKMLIGKQVAVKDLPELWNSMYMKYLGVQAKDFKTGVLQDVHWSHGSFGYFPTYSLGSFYAAQFYKHAVKTHPAIIEEMRTGQFGTLLHYLRTEVHQFGRKYNSEELCTKITGKPLDINEFIDYIHHKYNKILS